MPANIPTQGQSILVDTPESAQSAAQPKTSSSNMLVSWVIERTRRWEEARNRGYQKTWGEYWRMWRGKWAPEDMNRQSERSRLIAPALAQAIEQSVAEAEEALFSREIWFDVDDNLGDAQKLDAAKARDQLIEDLELVNAKDQLLEAVTNSAIFGTGIVKISTSVESLGKPERNAETKKMEASTKERVVVTVESIRPDEFVPDPAGRTIQEMLGVAHHIGVKPLHSVLESIESGMYREDALAELFPQQRMSNSDIDWDDPQSMLSSADTDNVDIIEYHGKVPVNLFNRMTEKKTALDEVLSQDIMMNPDAGDGPMIEAIVTIANSSVLLRAIANPFVMKDRSIIAFQWEKVPGRFWGRGVSEKGYNPQKALDAEIRARIDALGYISAPMLGVDSGRIPRGFKMEVKPGKVWTTQGPPGEVLQPIKIGDLNAGTFNQASEMERMVQMGTGAFDTATALNTQSQSGSNSMSSNSMLMGAFVKRAKRSVQNIERNLLAPLIKKVMWRYMQFDPVRYPTDYEFNVKATMGIVAREAQAMQMTQLIGMIPKEFGKVAVSIAKGVIESAAVTNKAEVAAAIAEAMKPPSEEEQQKQKQMVDMQMQVTLAQGQQVLLQNQKTIAETQKLVAEAKLALHKAGTENVKLDQEQQKLDLMSEELEQFAVQNRISAQNLNLKAQEIKIKEKALAQKPKTGA